MNYLPVIALSAVLIVSCGDGKKDPHAGHDHSATMEKKTTQDMGGDNHASMEMAKKTAAGEKLIYYTCPMESHKQVHSADPGQCPECNMALVAGTITTEDKMDFYGCPMLIHSHVRQEEPGRCDECKMVLKPMRLAEAAG